LGAILWRVLILHGVGLFFASSDTGVNFNNMYTQLLQADPKSAKKQSSQQCIFVLVGSWQVKADSKMLKSTPGVNFTKIL